MNLQREERAKVGGATSVPVVAHAGTPEGRKHFCTDHLLVDLGKRVASGSVLTVAAQAVRFVIYLVATVVLARVLSKEDFGLVAMVGTLISFLRMFREGGLSTATIQKSSITSPQVSNLFWVNVGLGCAAAASASLLSPAVAWFYHEPRLIAVTCALGCTFILSGSTVQHLALLNRQMRFLALACVDIGSVSLGLLAGILMALRGFGYWSLVGMQAATTVGEFVLAWAMSGWVPHLPSRGAGTKSMLRFGGSLTFSTLLRRVASSTDSILLGRLYGADVLGVYSRGMALIMRPLDQFLVPFDTVFLPVLSRLQEDPARYRRSFLRIYDVVVLSSFICGGLLLGLARPLVLAALGVRWAEVVPVFAALAAAAVYYPASCATLWLLATQQRSRDIMTVGTLVSVVTLASYGVGLRFGAVGVALAGSLSGLALRLPLQFRIIGRSGPVKTKDLWLAMWRHLPTLLAVLAATRFSTVYFRGASFSAQSLIGVVAGTTLAVSVMLVIPYQRRILLDLGKVATPFLSAAFSGVASARR